MVTCNRCRDTGWRRTLGGKRRCACPAAPPKPEPKRGPRSASHEGECGFCERRFTVSQGEQRLALHGFQRPGTGWLVGDCPGHGQQPVELSKETLELLQDYARRMVAIEEAALARYRSGEMPLSYQVRRAGAHVLANVYESIPVKPGDRYDSILGIPSYDDLLASLIQESEIRLGQMRRAEARAKYRIGVWEPGTLKEIK